MRKAAAAAGIVFCLSLALTAARHLLAEVYVDYAQSLSYGGGDPRVGGEALRIATRLVPGRPDYLEWLGFYRLYQGDLTEGWRLFTASLMVRPGWPYAWANFAQQLADEGRFDDTLNLALERSNALGPAEVNIQLAIAQLALQYWSQVGERLPWLAASVDFSLQHASGELLEIARQQGLEPLLCRCFGGSPALSGRCQPMAATTLPCGGR